MNKKSSLTEEDSLIKEGRRRNFHSTPSILRPPRSYRGGEEKGHGHGEGSTTTNSEALPRGQSWGKPPPRVKLTGRQDCLKFWGKPMLEKTSFQWLLREAPFLKVRMSDQAQTNGVVAML